MRKIRNILKPLALCMFTGMLSLSITQNAWASYGSVDDYYDEIEDDRYVYDFGDILSASEEDDLQDMIEEAIDKADLHIAVMTVDNNFGNSQMRLADYFQNELLWDYEENFERRSGVMLLIDMDDRQLYITTTGIAILTVNEAMIETILDDIQSEASDGDYEEVCQEFVEDVVYFSKTAKDTDTFEKVIKEWNTGKYVDYEEFYRKMKKEIDAIDNMGYAYNRGGIVTDDSDKADKVGDLYESGGKDGFRKETFFTLFCNPLVDLAIGAVIALIFVLVNRNPKSASMTANSHTYRQGNDLKVNRRQDIFIRRTTTKRVIESNSGGGKGGGSFHSSGGRSHGGGGRGF